MEILMLKVETNVNKLDLLESRINALKDRTITLNIDTGGKSDKALSSLAKIETATAKIKKAEADLAAARERTKQSADQRAVSENNLATQMERTATAEEQARRANTMLSVEIQKTTTEQAKQGTVAAQTALQQEKTATAVANLGVQQEKTATAAQNLAIQQERTAAAGSGAAVGIKQAGDAAEKTGDSFFNAWQKMLFWKLAGDIIFTPLKALKEALSEMKAVDDELVTVRKVTGFTAEQMAALEKQAYKTASAYGQMASEYLKSTATFSSAGYRELSASLAELSTKAQIVGDMDAKTANQFLLTVDAAYKYKGSVTELTRVLDGANEIDNKYATTIGKIAEGLGKVAPVAAQAHISVGELSAALGTITAATQRSGTEAATAFRALVLNILGDTKTEIDEGVTWTTGEIAGLKDVIKIYAKDAYDAAQATGSLINPMEAIAGLAQSMKDGLLTEQQLMSMVSDIGGKLRTSQLLALIQNWDMYKSMLEDFGDSAGSADKEVANALDSWTRKSAVLKNTWTEMVTNFVNTGEIKGALDGIIGLVNLLNTDTGRAVITIGLVTAAIMLLKGAIEKAAVSAAALKALTEAGWIALVVTAIYGVVKAVDVLTVSLEEQKQIVSDLAGEVKSLQSEYDQLLGKDDRTEDEQKKLDLLAAQLKIKKETLALEAKELERRTFSDDTFKTAYYWDANGNSRARTDVVKGGRSKAYDDARNYELAQKDIVAYKEKIEELGKAEGGTAAEIRARNKELDETKTKLETAEKSLSGYAKAITDTISTLEGFKENGVELDAEQEKLLDSLYKSAYAFGVLTKQADGAADGMGKAATAAEQKALSLKKLLAAISSVQDAYNFLDKAQKEQNETGYLSIDTVTTLLDKYPELEKYLVEVAGGYRLSNGALKDYIATQQAQYKLAVDDATAAANAVIDAEALKAAAFDTTTMSIREQLIAMRQIYGLRASEARAEFLDKYGDDVIGRQLASKAPKVIRNEGLMWEAQNALDNYDVAVKNLSGFDRAISSVQRDANVKSSRAKSTEEYRAETDKLYEAKKRVADIEEDITRIRAKSALENDQQKQIDYLNQAIPLLKDQQNAVHDLVDQRRTLISGNVDKLRRMNFDIDYDPATNDLFIKNMEHVNDLKGKDQDATNKLRKETETLIKATSDMNEENKSGADSWWKLGKDIKSASDEIEKLRKEQLKTQLNTAGDILDKLKGNMEAELSILDTRLDRLKSENDSRKNTLELEKKILAVEKARVSLHNAENERTVLQYNAAKDQWEHVADAKVVSSAKESLQKAEEDLFEYRRAAAYEREKKDIEDRQKNIKAAYKSFEDTWKDASKAVENGTMTLAQAFAMLDAKVAEILVANHVNYSSAASGVKGALQSSTLDIMQQNSAAYAKASPEEKARLAAENKALGEGQGWTRGADGVWYSKSGSRVYDTGGLLYGKGAITGGYGVKATDRPEGMILDPALTAQMLAPTSDKVFRERVAQLGFLFGSSQSFPGMERPISAGPSSNDNSRHYSINGVPISQQQADTMTVSQLVRSFETLPVYPA